MVAPASVPKPTVTTATLAAAASRAAAATSSTGSNASPSLMTMIARSPPLGEACSNSVPCRMVRASELPACPTTSGSRLSRNSSIAPASVVSGVRM
jgi:hypothetical protein